MPTGFIMVFKKKVFITVKTYPTLSSKYIELVCTAGILEDGSWIRIYPLSFRRLADYNKFSKYSWIEIELEEHKSDNRPESYRPCNCDKIKILNSIGTGKNRDWSERKELLLHHNYIYKDMDKLIQQAKNDKLSIAIFKPKYISTLNCEKVDPEWDQEKLKKAKASLNQRNIFEEKKVDDTFKLMPKLPYKFSYSFEDINGKHSKLMITDWEIGQLYWNCLKNHNNNEKLAILDVKKKYYYDFTKKKDIYLFLGTTSAYHNISPNPFIIIGTFYPPIIQQQTLNI